MDFKLTCEDFNTMWYCVDSETMDDYMKNLAIKLGEIYDHMKNNNIDFINIHLNWG